MKKKLINQEAIELARMRDTIRAMRACRNDFQSEYAVRAAKQMYLERMQSSPSGWSDSKFASYRISELLELPEPEQGPSISKLWLGTDKMPFRLAFMPYEQSDSKQKSEKTRSLPYKTLMKSILSDTLHDLIVSFGADRPFDDHGQLGQDVVDLLSDYKSGYKITPTQSEFISDALDVHMIKCHRQRVSSNKQLICFHTRDRDELELGLAERNILLSLFEREQPILLLSSGHNTNVHFLIVTFLCFHYRNAFLESDTAVLEMLSDHIQVLRTAGIYIDLGNINLMDAMSLACDLLDLKIKRHNYDQVYHHIQGMDIKASQLIYDMFECGQYEVLHRLGEHYKNHPEQLTCVDRHKPNVSALYDQMAYVFAGHDPALTLYCEQALQQHSKLVGVVDKTFFESALENHSVLLHRLYDKLQESQNPALFFRFARSCYLLGCAAPTAAREAYYKIALSYVMQAVTLSHYDINLVSYSTGLLNEMFDSLPSCMLQSRVGDTYSQLLGRYQKRVSDFEALNEGLQALNKQFPKGHHPQHILRLRAIQASLADDLRTGKQFLTQIEGSRTLLDIYNHVFSLEQSNSYLQVLVQAPCEQLALEIVELVKNLKNDTDIFEGNNEDYHWVLDFFAEYPAFTLDYQAYQAMFPEHPPIDSEKLYHERQLQQTFLLPRACENVLALCNELSEHSPAAGNAIRTAFTHTQNKTPRMDVAYSSNHLIHSPPRVRDEAACSSMIPAQATNSQRGTKRTAAKETDELRRSPRWKSLERRLSIDYAVHHDNVFSKELRRVDPNKTRMTERKTPHGDEFKVKSRGKVVHVDSTVVEEAALRRVKSLCGHKDLSMYELTLLSEAAQVTPDKQLQGFAWERLQQQYDFSGLSEDSSENSLQVN